MNSALEDYLASLPEDDWQALTARVREPSSKEAAAEAVRAKLHTFPDGRHNLTESTAEAKAEAHTALRRKALGTTNGDQ